MTEEPEEFLTTTFKDSGQKAPWWIDTIIYDRMCANCGAPEVYHASQGDFCPNKVFMEQRKENERRERFRVKPR